MLVEGKHLVSMRMAFQFASAHSQQASSAFVVWELQVFAHFDLQRIRSRSQATENS